MKKSTGFLQLMRPANCVTAVADVLAGVAISGYLSDSNLFTFAFFKPILLLCVATIGLYGGGVVFNDVFDAELDAVERPERPIPSGHIKKIEAKILGIFLLSLGCITALMVSFTAAYIAVLIVASSLVYDKWGKHQNFIGPINMGLCRGLNLLLGISILPAMVLPYRGLALVPIIYIAAITMISRGEVHGGKKTTLYFAAFLYSMVIGCILYFAWLQATLLFTIAFIVAFGIMIFQPLVKAIKEPVGRNIGKAVKAGVLALILMNAAWAAAFGQLYLALFIVLLLPLSVKLGKYFAVT